MTKIGEFRPNAQESHCICHWKSYCSYMDSPLSETRRIIHIDMDAFFAAVEQRDHPDLRGKPVAVGSCKARSVVAAASYEARKFGIRSGMPAFKAAQACPDLIFKQTRFDVYRAVSAQINGIFAQYTDLIEPVSLDEAWLDVSQACQDGTTATGIAGKIRADILRITNLTASAGVSYNKFLAKMASGQDKPNGQTVIPPNRGPAFVSELSVGRFHGIGPVTEQKMHVHGIRTGADLRGKSLEWLGRYFGSSARHYHDICRGIDPRPVNPDRIRKSIGAEETFPEDLHDLDLARAALEPIMEKVSARCAARDVQGKTLTLKVKYADFEQITRRKTMRFPTRDVAQIIGIAEMLLEGLYPFRNGIRLLGISMSGLETPAEGQPVQTDFMDCLDPAVS